ncbi:MAG: SDR family oxidoreductase [Anaerolineae bacterium]|jgi:short-subunit dehydrogenase|nr:SDR family oxidoreductase [Anaerolineae bacterium]
MEVTDKVILITGGGKGIGRKCTNLFAVKGNTIIITGRTETALKETTEALAVQGYKVSYHVGDVTSREDCQRIVADVVNQFGRLDVLINNAGMSSRGLFEETSLESFQKVIDINFVGAVNMTKFALPAIKSSQGSIVFISSLSGLKGLPGIAPYGTAKMALTAFSDSLRVELFSAGVHVGILYVGFTENDANKTVYDPNGNLMPIPDRKNFDTQENVAKAVYHCVRKRKNKMLLTTMGKAVYLIYQFFPRLSDLILLRWGSKIFLRDNDNEQ